MGRKFLQLIDFITDVSGRVAAIAGMAAMIATVWGIAWTWAKQIDTVQKILFSFATLCFFVVFLYLFGRWWRKHNLERLPDLIDKLDNITMHYIDNSEYTLSVNDWQAMLGEYGTLIGMDFHRLITATTEHKDSVTDEELGRLQKFYDRKMNPNKLAAGINELRDIGELLNEYNIGLKALKETRKYKQLIADIKDLQRQLPNVAISAKVNEYLYQSEGFYNLLLSTKPLLEMRLDTKSQMLTRVGVKKGQVRPIVEGQIANLITSIRESIIAYKERNINPPEKK